MGEEKKVPPLGKEPEKKATMTKLPKWPPRIPDGPDTPVKILTKH
jgi:hypothetical protein